MSDKINIGLEHNPFPNIDKKEYIFNTGFGGGADIYKEHYNITTDSNGTTITLKNSQFKLGDRITIINDLINYDNLNSDLLALIELNKNNPNQLVIDLQNQFNIKYK